MIVLPPNPTQTELPYPIELKLARISSSGAMADVRTEELVIKLAETLGFSSLESRTKLVEVIIADKIPNRGAIKNILSTA